jgi:serine protease AprX
MLGKSCSSESGLFDSRIFFGFGLCSIGMVLALLSFAAPPPRVPNGSAAVRKIAPWVFERTANGQQAEFLVVLVDQADLKGAQALKTKEEKGRHVRDTLWKKAQTTQAPILQWLRERNIEHRSYFIVNLIWVKGTLDVAQALAARTDVLRIEGNPRIRNIIPEPLPVTESSASPDATTTVETGITYSRAPEVWALGYTGQGIVVAGADTGYRWDHTALKNH